VALGAIFFMYILRPSLLIQKIKILLYIFLTYYLFFHYDFFSISLFVLFVYLFHSFKELTAIEISVCENAFYFKKYILVDEIQYSWDAGIFIVITGKKYKYYLFKDQLDKYHLHQLKWIINQICKCT
jgi:hypothetical protein